MPRHTRLRAAALIAVPALALGGIVASPTAVQAAPATAPADRTAAWLANQLTDGVIHNDQYDFDDVGLSIDTGLAADALGESAVVSKVAAGVSAQVGGYVGDGTTESYAGALGKAATFAEVAGRDPRAFGGIDLITRLEQRVTASGAAAGRVVDASEFGDYANTLSQSFAVQALEGASSASAAPALAFLLDQQCDPGYFRLSLSAADAADQGCDSAAATGSEPSVDATATALRVLLALDTDDDAVNAAIDSAIDWLVSKQNTDGSFGSDAAITTANANSTGLAGWALGLADQGTPARKAAVWLRAHQVVNAGACVAYRTADTGAIAYDDMALAGLAGKRIGAVKQDQFRRATAQALPALAYAPAGGDIVAPFTAEYVRAGTKPTLRVRGAAPGELVCLSTEDGETAVARIANNTGSARAAFRLPKTTGRSVFLISTADGLADRVVVKALGAADLRVSARSTVAAGGRQEVVVRDLAPAETVTLRVGGVRVASGQATDSGVFRATYRVTKPLGSTRLVAVGAFDDRRGSASYTVTR